MASSKAETKRKIASHGSLGAVLMLIFFEFGNPEDSIFFVRGCIVVNCNEFISDPFEVDLGSNLCHKGAGPKCCSGWVCSQQEEWPDYLST